MMAVLPLEEAMLIRLTPELPSWERSMLDGKKLERRSLITISLPPISLAARHKSTNFWESISRRDLQVFKPLFYN